MKKHIVLIATSIVILSNSYAQYDPTIWQVEDSTVNVQSITGLAPSNHYDDELPMIFGSGWIYETTWIGDALQIDFTNPVGDNWTDFGFLLWYPEGTSTNYFTRNINGVEQDHNIIKGYSVDFTESSNRTVSFKYQATNDLNLRIDLKDIAGKMTNGAHPTMSLGLLATSTTVDLNNGSLWKTVTYSWGGDATADIFTNNLEDLYSGSWLGISTTGIRDAINPIDSTRITGISFVIDDGSRGTDGEQKTIYIKDVQIGEAIPQTFDLSEIYPPHVSVENDSIQIYNPSQDIPITIYSNSEWSVSGIEPWFRVSQSSGYGDQTIYINIDDTVTVRKEANLIFTSLNGNVDTIKIKLETNVCNSLYPNTQIMGDFDVCIEDTKLYTLATLNQSNVEWRISGDNLLYASNPQESNTYVDWLEVGIDTIYVQETTWDGCVGKDSVIVEIELCNTGLLTVTNEYLEYSFENSNIKIVGLKGNANIIISDIAGKQLLTKQIQSDESFSIESLPKGVYIVKVISDSGTAQMKLVKK